MKLYLSEALREYFKNERSLSYRELGKRIGVSPSTVHGWAWGDSSIILNVKTLKALELLRKELGFSSVEELLFVDRGESSIRIQRFTSALYDLIKFEINKRIGGMDGKKR